MDACLASTKSTAQRVGAAVWGNGSRGRAGFVTTDSALVGSSADDQVGDGILPLENGDYAVQSSRFTTPFALRGGAVTLSDGTNFARGVPSASNSVLGTASNMMSDLSLAYDPGRRTLVVGTASGNRVTLLTLPPPLIFRTGFE